jgi:hypothetical protein
MQKMFLKLTGLIVAAAIIFSTGCTEDEPGGGTGNDLPPIIRFENGADLLVADAEVEVGQSFKVQITALTGDADLATLAINANGSRLATSEMLIEVASTGEVITNNPLALIAFAQGFTLDVTITPATVVDDVVEYTFIVTDDNSLSDEVSLTITTVAPPGTPLEKELTGILFNQAGPVGTGGLDLDTGDGAGSMADTIEIRDLGISCTIPNDQETWRAQIGTVNGADMRLVDVTQLEEGFSFDKVETQEVIVDAYNTGIVLADGESTAADCTTTAVTDVSDTVVPGDMFAVFANGKYYLIHVDEVNYVLGAVPPERNDDSYTLSIKF